MAEELPNIGDLSKIEELLQGEDGKMPSLKEMFDILEDSEMDDELKESFKAMLGGGTPQIFGSYGTSLGIAFAALIFFLLLFFGYKLYKSIKDKELRKEEKKKAKQMKKKK